jgi:hypothetical protein
MQPPPQALCSTPTDDCIRQSRRGSRRCRKSRWYSRRPFRTRTTYTMNGSGRWPKRHPDPARSRRAVAPWCSLDGPWFGCHGMLLLAQWAAVSPEAVLARREHPRYSRVLQACRKARRACAEAIPCATARSAYSDYRPPALRRKADPGSRREARHAGTSAAASANSTTIASAADTSRGSNSAMPYRNAR